MINIQGTVAKIFIYTYIYILLFKVENNQALLVKIKKGLNTAVMERKFNCFKINKLLDYNLITYFHPSGCPNIKV